MNLTETLKSREQLLDGVLLKVYRDTVALPGGAESVREWIDHPGASAVVPLFDDGTVVLLRQYRYPPQREFLEVPAGKLDKGDEAPEAVAQRELGEEAGLRAGRFTSLGQTFPCIGYSNEVIHLFLAEDLSEVEGRLEEDEFVVPVRMPFAEAVAMARRGEILDGKSCVALLLAAAHLDARAR
ncbi:MAG TPA: NUDIX hydrolase [Rubricoccaceae bacterium]|nr:NUDIX hydrolase [Rubricoccaceae bacterium]